jgi:sulfur carrier protein ThiS
MKRIIQGLVLATLISTAQASPFPDNGDPVSLPAQWTYADRHAGEGNMQVGSAIPGNGDPVSLPAELTYADQFAGEGDVQLGSAIPGNGDPVSLPAELTYADQFATDRARHAASSIE